MLTRLAAILFVIGPRDLGQVFIALLWSMVAELPSLLIHAIGGALAGVVLTALLLLAGSTLYPRIGRNAITLSACLALLSCLLFGVAAALLRVQNPVLALQRGPLEFLIAMIPALAGLVWGVPLAGRLRRYLAARLGR